MSVLPYDEVEVPGAKVVATISRPRGVDAKGRPLPQPLPGALRIDEPSATSWRSTERQLLTDLHIAVDDVYFALVAGRANTAYIDETAAVPLDEDGYHSVPDVDGLFGYTDTVKACRLGDCGMLVVTGTDHAGRAFNGFLHTTRLNLNGDTQFTDTDGTPRGGVELMLRSMLVHYRPQNVKLRLVAGIAPQFYVHNFAPTEEELATEPSLTAAEKKRRGFSGWEERGWLKPIGDGWYQADMYAAVRHQVERAGLLDVYRDAGALDGNPVSGHASHRAARLGKVEETRDLYLLIPHDYHEG